MSSIRVRLVAGASDPALVARAAAAIARGDRVVLPTETVYGLCADPRSALSIERVLQLKERDATRRFTHHLASPSQLQLLAPPPPPRVQRLIERYWPGPLTVIVAGHDGEPVGLRVPAHAFTQAVIAELGHSLFMTSVNRAGEPPLLTPDEIERDFADRIDLLCDDGPPKLRLASTIVEATGPELKVLREGILSRDEVLRAAARTLLFICSGNTCRSPLAEALARAALARALGVTSEALLARGVRVVSAGTATLAGMPASELSTAAAAEIGLDLGAHRSQPLTRELAKEAAVILCMSHGHRQRLLDLEPSLHEKTWLLDPGGEDVDDPFGAELGVYRATRDQIRALIEARVPDFLKATGAG